MGFVIVEIDVALVVIFTVGLAVIRATTFGF